MQYLNEKFSVALSGPKYADGWEAIFGKKDPPPGDCVRCSGTGTAGPWGDADDRLPDYAVTCNRCKGTGNEIVEVAPINRSGIRKQVEAFHEAMGIAMPSSLGVPSDDIVRLRLRLIAEEFFELLQAVCEPSGALNDAEQCVACAIARPLQVDIVEFADACGDLDYVVEGARLAFGINGQQIADEIHFSNMAKAGGPAREDGKRLKPEGWLPPQIAGELVKQGWTP